MVSNRSLLKLGRFKSHVAYGGDTILAYHFSHPMTPSVGPRIHERLLANNLNQKYSSDINIGNVEHVRNLSYSAHKIKGINVELRWTDYNTILQFQGPDNSKRNDACKLLKEILS